MVGTCTAALRATLSREHLVNALLSLFSCLDVHEAEKSLDGVGTNKVDVHLVSSGSIQSFLLGLALLSPLEGRRATVLLAFNFDADNVGCVIRVDHSLDWGLQVRVNRGLLGRGSGPGLVHFLGHPAVKTVTDGVLLFKPALVVLLNYGDLCSSI